MSVTYEEILMLFRETDRRVQEIERQMKETDRRVQEIERLMKETSQETEGPFQETDRLIKQLSKNFGEIGIGESSEDRFEAFVRCMVIPAVVRLFQEQGIDEHAVFSPFSIKRNGVALLVGPLVVNDGALVAVECKSRVTKEHVDQHRERLAKLKTALPIYKHHKAMGAVAGMVVSDEVARYAQEQGLYVLCQNGEHIHLQNPREFEPAVW